MIEIEDKIISADLFTARFCCDLKSCHGQCCVDGNSGAPLDEDEIEQLEADYDNYSPYMKPEGLEAILEHGVAVLDEDGDLTTTLIQGAECAYSIEHDGGTWCAIEKAWFDGKSRFRKPISCHLYPIRVVKFNNGTQGLQYHRWNICRAAEILGQIKGEPLYRTLKEPIIRAWGAEFFDALEQVERVLDE